MKNNKGFVLSTYVYMLLVFFLLLLSTMLAVLNNTKLLSNKLKENSSTSSGLINNEFNIVLLGDNEIIVGLDSEYIEPGYIAKTISGKDISGNVDVIGEVNTSQIGEYTLTYRIKHDGKTKELERKIRIVDNIAVNYINELYLNEKGKHGLIVDDTDDQNIRYAGADPKNKVYFNCKDEYDYIPYGNKEYDYDKACEVWRIIGVFDTKSSESETETPVKRVKIVRDAVLDTTMSWDTTADGVDAINQWSETTLRSDNTSVYAGASLMQYLNIGGTSYYSSLSSISKEQISNVLWYTGSATKGTASVVYSDERSKGGGSAVIKNKRTWVGNIGLIYSSDFAYAGINCGSYTIFDYGKEGSCGKIRNWLTPERGNYWSISPNYGNGNRAWSISSSGSAFNGYVSDNNGVRPALYLSANIKIIGGNGDTEPYKLKNIN